MIRCTSWAFCCVAIRALPLVALASSVAGAQPGAEPVPDSDAKTNPVTEAAPEPVRDSDAKTNPVTESETAEPAQTNPVTAEEAEPPKPRTPFDRGRFGLSAGAGTTSVFDQRYFGIGVAAGYFVLDGVAIDLGTEVQWGDGPTILRTRPGLRYVAQPLVGKWPLIPYVAGYYTHWFVGDAIADVDAVGTRGGLLYVSGSLVLGLGVGYEHLVSECTMDCSSVYPDLTISIAL